jgi:N-acetylated-alpha-linked acidic dipeptidase
MKRPLVLAWALAGLSPAVADEPSALEGFDAAAAQAERRYEEQLKAIPSPERMRAAMEHLAGRPHHVGTAADKENAEWILARFKEAGWEAQIERFDVLYPTPRERVLELVAPGHFAARLDEPPVDGDPTSAQRAEQLPGYNAYAVDGDVTAPLVYVNYGLRDDYDRLERLGVSVKGAIVIARYGGSWRGIKPKLAAEHGAVGCLIYSDPADDGYAVGAVYPEGPMRPKDGVQRGSVADMPLQPGDPLTPGVAARPGAKRLPLARAATLTKIPTLPISYGDAQPLLEALRGPVAPESWRGALPITYHVGPGPAKVHLKLASSWDLRPIYDVIARLPGAVAPDEWVVRGNHHDAWVNGAVDPISGLVAELEEARALGELVKAGWRPRRTIIYAAWDGEEPLLLGSTEWVEAHVDELRRSAVAYINSDSNGRGALNMAGSPSLERLLNGVARDVEDPETRLSLLRRRQLIDIVRGSQDERAELRKRADVHLHPLGSGSDYGAFVAYAGVASLSLGFGGEDDSGIYHSVYDDATWFAKNSDGDFHYGRALARVAALAVMRLADAELVPLRFGAQADAFDKWIGDAKKLLDKKRDEARERDLELDEGAFQAASDPRRPTYPPPRLDLPPRLSWAPLENALDALREAARRFDAAAAKLPGAPAATLAAWNRALIGAEQRLCDPAGLARRTWYRNLAYAPGVYTGYAAATLPGVTEAIEGRRWAEADAEIVRAGRALASEAALVERLAAELEKAPR